ncbi:MAG: UvrD-helicase domain-containing protein [Bacteroidales bacterium]|nr:UvrD-helicase domain-containing protein [Bacteroidales bacterium]
MIRILKASAGSGKTYNLAREYIRLLLEKNDPQAYRHILAVTFTNKATDEMKRRILQELHVLASDPEASPYYDDFVPSIFPEREALRRRASGQLSAILHDYSAFAVSTIDKFFQQTLRAFSREIGQFASYQVDLDRKGLVEESVDRLLDGLTEEDRALLDWLTENVKSGLERGIRFNLEKPLKEMAVSLKSEDHEGAVRRYGVDEDAAYSRTHLKEVREACEAAIRSFVREVETAARAVLDVLDRHRIAPADSNRGFLKALYAYVDLDPREEVAAPSASFLEKSADPSKWFSKGKDALRMELEGDLEQPLAAFCALFGRLYKTYRTAWIIRDQIYGLGIAGELKKTFSELQKEKNVISIDDSNTILKDIIDGSDAPFVYEKLGVRFEDFLLDEFQDTSAVQWENLRPLLRNSEAGGFDNLVVGDVKQSIYRFRGSDWRLLDSGLQREFGPGAASESVLDGNYRTCRTIVGFNNEFFPFAAGQLDAMLGGGSISRIYRDVSQKVCLKDPAEGSVDVCFRGGAEEEMEEILRTIRSVQERGGLPGDIAILVRGRDEGSEIAARLVSEGIPVVSDDSLLVKSSVTVRRLVSQLSLIAAPAGSADRSVAGYLARQMGIRIPDHFHSLMDLCEALLRDIRKADPEMFGAEIPYVQSFMDFLLDWTGLHGNNLSAFLRDWEEADPKIASPDSGSSIRVMTIHKSKGLEFPYVIFPFAEKVPLYKRSSYWCRPEVEGTALDGVADGVYHMVLSSGSSETLFAEDYRREREMQCIDNINIFYVALTRAKYGLKIIASEPSQKLLKALSGGGPVEWKNMSELLYAYVGQSDYQAGALYDFSAMKRDDGPAEPVEAGWPSFEAGERGRLKFSRDAADFFGPDGLVGPQVSNRLRGLVLHDILSAVKVPEDLPRAVDRSVAAGGLPASDRARTVQFLSERIASVADRGWFAPDGVQVLNEVPLIGPDGTEHRPDRVLLREDGSIVIIDYKFGQRAAEYAGQVSGYMELYHQLGYAAVEGFLWYVETGEVVSV